MSISRWAGVPALLSVLVLGASCAAPLEPERPNVLLITLDTIRRDHCSVYGYDRETTPRLSEFAERGARFDLAYAPMATTAPSHATIFTSLYPITHRVVQNGLILGGELPTLAEALADRGYQTAAVVSSFVLDDKFGYGRGFESWNDEFPRDEATLQPAEWLGHTLDQGFDRRADATTRAAIAWLETQRDSRRPFLLFAHYFDPHDPYVPPPEWRARFAVENGGPLAEAIAAYDAEIAFADDEIGKLLDAVLRLGLEGETLVVIVGDHGEGLMQHAHMAHGVQVYEELVRVPLLLRMPGAIPPGTVLDAPVELVDVAPTVLDLVGLGSEGWKFQGRNLGPALRGEQTLEAERAVFLQRRHYEPQVVGAIAVRGDKFAIRAENWKYIVGEEEGTRELYDLAHDPAERTNLLRHAPERAVELAARLEEWKLEHERVTELPEIPEDDRERLRAIGYVD